MAMDKVEMKAKIAAAYTLRTGEVMSEGEFNALIDICQGIIEELLANAVIEVSGITPGVGTANGVILS